MELMHEAAEEPYKFDEGWIARFMTKLAQEDPKLAAAVMQAADDRLKELNDKTI